MASKKQGPPANRGASRDHRHDDQEQGTATRKCGRWEWRQAIHDATDLPTSAKAVAHSLAMFMDDVGRCWPSVELQAEKTGLHRATVIRALNQLEHDGYLVRSSRGSGRGHSTVYEARLPKESHHATDSSGKGRTEFRKGRTGSRKGSHPATRIRKESDTNPVCRNCEKNEALGPHEALCGACDFEAEKAKRQEAPDDDGLQMMWGFLSEAFEQKPAWGDAQAEVSALVAGLSRSSPEKTTRLVFDALDAEDMDGELIRSPVGWLKHAARERGLLPDLKVSA